MNEKIFIEVAVKSNESFHVLLHNLSLCIIGYISTATVSNYKY